MVRQDLREDFKQELFIIICTQPKEKIIDLYNKSQLRYFVVRIIINLVSQKRNVFHKTYLQPVYELKDTQDEHSPEETTRKENFFRVTEERIAKMDNHFGTFYYRLLVEVLKKHGSMSEASRQTGIPVATICRGIKKVREYLKSFDD